MPPFRFYPVSAPMWRPLPPPWCPYVAPPRVAIEAVDPHKTRSGRCADCSKRHRGRWTVPHVSVAHASRARYQNTRYRHQSGPCQFPSHCCFLEPPIYLDRVRKRAGCGLYSSLNVKSCSSPSRLFFMSVLARLPLTGPRILAPGPVLFQRAARMVEFVPNDARKARRVERLR